MKFLGIDYGSKRVGIAISDDGGDMAFPKVILNNDKNLPNNIKKICEEEKIAEIILGESLKSTGEQNKIMGEIKKFKAVIEKETGLPVLFEPEFMTSMHADILPEKGSDKNITRANNKTADAAAAALILQRFLDKQ